MRLTSCQLATRDGVLPELTVFDSDRTPADPDALERVRAGVRGADLAAPPVVLPDFHHKRDMEMPSSVVVATLETIRPTLTSASVNCGMALIAFDMERPDPSAVSAFFRRIRERYPYPPTKRRELRSADVLRCAVEGAAFGVERFGLETADLERFEEDGRLDVERFGGVDAIRRQLPWITLQLARMRFGTVGPSNHFIELQQVEEILDPPAARVLGVDAGQMTVQYHGGGGVLATQIGRLFGRRSKYSRSQRIHMAVQKPLFHLASARSISQVRDRLALYFSNVCPPIPREDPEGQRLMLANAVAMNYGFAFRAATYGTLTRLATECFGGTGARLVVDSPHNSVYEEEVGGEMAVVHRHNACRAFPAAMMPGGTAFGEVGQAVLLPGSHRTSSYLCVATDGASRSLHSTCHGAGTMIDRLVQAGISDLHPDDHRTLRFRYSDAAPSEDPHFDDRGVDEALAILVENDLVRPVARMRPIGVLN